MLEYDSDGTPLHAAFFEALSIPSIVHGHATFVAVNAAARRLLDFDQPEDIEGLPITAIVPLTPVTLIAGGASCSSSTVTASRAFQSSSSRGRGEPSASP